MGYWNTSHIKHTLYGAAYHDALRGTSKPLKLQGFVSLLRSEETAIVGVALDHYSECVAMERHGMDNPFEPYDADVLAQARRLLRQAPVIKSQESNALEGEANHASAAAAMLNLAEYEDTEIFEKTLRNSRSKSVRLGVILAASSVFMDEPDGDRNGPLIELLGEILLNGQSPYQERSAALSSLPEVVPEKSFKFITKATAVNDIRIQSQALMILAEEDISLYGELIERVVASWPEDVPYPAADVLDMLRKHRAY